MDAARGRVVIDSHLHQLYSCSTISFDGFISRDSVHAFFKLHVLLVREHVSEFHREVKTIGRSMVDCLTWGRRRQPIGGKDRQEAWSRSEGPAKVWLGI